MPVYEYISREDGEVIELIRPMADADRPVADPAGKGRRFVRKPSGFAARSGATGGGAIGGSSGGAALPRACCPCGKPGGGCGGG